MTDTGRRSSASDQQTGPFVAGKIILEALRKKKHGDASDYNLIVRDLCANDIPATQLRRWLQGLCCCISSLGQGCDKLVGATLQLPWVHRDAETVVAYIDYLADLVAAHAEYHSPCVFMLVKLFRFDELRDLKENLLAFDRALTGMTTILNIVPVGIRCVKQHLLSACPYKGKPQIVQEYFVVNALSLVNSNATLTSDILEILMEHLVKLDVDICREELEAELETEPTSEESEGDVDTQFKLELDGEAAGSEGGNDAAAAAAAAAVVACCPENVAAAKLDVCMTHMLLFFKRHSCSASGDFQLDGATYIFQALSKVFENVLLPTHGTSHVQFLLFYTCSFHQSFVEGFLHLLWSKIEDVNCPAVTRQAAAAYMSSFVARAKYVPTSTVTLSLKILSDWLVNYIKSHDSSARSIPDVNAHRVFYSVSQALLYIFVFRHRHLMNMTDATSYIRSLNLERLVSCRLNPLKVCLESIVEVFAAITHKHEFVFCYTIVERNRRIVMPTMAADGKTTPEKQIESFFPFHPYLLAGSGVHLSDLYIHWKDVADDAHICTEGETESDSESMGFPISPAPENIPFNLTPLSPMAMWISPGFD